MKKLWIGILIIALVALAIVFFVNQTKKEPEVIKIGAILPLSGPTAWLGEMHKWGIDLAVDEINAEGGIEGKKINIIYEDDQNDPKKAVSAFRKLENTENPQIVITAMSNSGMAVRPLAKKYETILFANGNHPGLVEGNEWVFRIFLTSEQEAKEMAEIAYENLGIKRIAVLYINDESGEGAQKAFKSHYETYGPEVLISEKYEKDGTDFRSEISKVLSTRPNAVYVIGYGNAAAKVLNQLIELGYKNLILGTSNFAGPPLTEIASEPLENSIFTSPYFDPRLQDSIVQNFVENIQEREDKTPQWNTAMEYDGIYVISKAIKESKTLEANNIRKALETVSKFDGVAGKYRYENREWLPKVVVRTYKDKTLKLYRMKQKEE